MRGSVAPNPLISPGSKRCGWLGGWASRGIGRSGSGGPSREPTGASLRERDLLRVGIEPLREGHEPGVESPRRARVPRGAELLLEVPLELEHVPEVLGAGEAERAVD